MGGPCPDRGPRLHLLHRHLDGGAHPEHPALLPGSPPAPGDLSPPLLKWIKFSCLTLAGGGHV